MATKKKCKCECCGAVDDSFHAPAEALDYLRREAVTLPADTPRGYVLVTYGGYPLGFVKNLGNRCNNLYPQYWKIKQK